MLGVEDMEASRNCTHDSTGSGEMSNDILECGVKSGEVGMQFPPIDSFWYVMSKLYGIFRLTE